MDPEKWIPIGVVGAAHGLRGEVWLRPFNPDSECFQPGRVLTTRGPSGSVRRLRVVASVARSPRGVLVRFEGIEDRTSARSLTGSEIAVQRKDLPPLDPGEFYHEDLIGLPVRTRSGQPIGRVAGLMKGATDILVLEGARGEVLVPFVEGFVAEVRDDAVILEDGALE